MSYFPIDFSRSWLSVRVWKILILKISTSSSCNRTQSLSSESAFSSVAITWLACKWARTQASLGDNTLAPYSYSQESWLEDVQMLTSHPHFSHSFFLRFPQFWFWSHDIPSPDGPCLNEAQFSIGPKRHCRREQRERGTDKENNKNPSRRK